MNRAIALARRGEGCTRPNPPVGAVLVRADRVVGEGYHRRAGGPHAEIHALRQAGAGARGATLYVTLEPCSTWGRTPPCTDAILAAGVKHVVVAIRDPNPRHAGRGLRLLRRKGVRVTEGVCADAARELLAPFAKWVTEQRPYVTLKLGISLDGRIADRTGSSRWITGPAARARVQALRRRVDAVMVGAGTVAADNPSLLPRPPRGRKPVRVILDAVGIARPNAKVFSDEAAGRTLLFVGPRYPRARTSAMRKRGVTVVAVRARGARLDLCAVMKELGRRGLLHVLSEGGGEIAAALIAARAVDEFLFFVSPRIIGGNTSRPAVGGPGWLLAEAPHLRFASVERVGCDILIRARAGD